MSHRQKRAVPVGQGLGERERVKTVHEVQEDGEFCLEGRNSAVNFGPRGGGLLRL